MKLRTSTLSLLPRITLLSASLVPLLLAPAAFAGGVYSNTLLERPSTRNAKALASCDETGLRDAIANAISGDVLDLTACSSITLTTGEIHVPLDDLTLVGPGSNLLTIDGGGGVGVTNGTENRIFDHTGIGTLWIDGLKVANAHYVAVSVPEGGCIYSSGFVKLTQTIVTQCVLDVPAATSAYAQGGAIYAREGVSMQQSSITNSVAHSALRGAYGGGAFSHGTFSASYSTIAGNSAISDTKYSSGGGILALGAGDFTLSSSSIFGNTATDAAGIHVKSTGVAEVVSSTISNNVSDRYVGGAAFLYDVTISGSTIVDNQASFANFGIGLHSAANATLNSSIVASNFAGQYSSDVSAQAIDGFQNIIMTSSVPTPFDTIAACPRLGPLADNGGPTLTRMPLSGSFAIDLGAPLASTVDQRGNGFPRIYNGLADIGSVEWQGDIGDSIFTSHFEVRCD